MEKIYLKCKMNMRFIARRRIRNALRYITISLSRKPPAPSKISEPQAPLCLCNNVKLLRINPHSQLCTNTDCDNDNQNLWLYRPKEAPTVSNNRRTYVAGDNRSKLIQNWYELKSKYRPNLRLLNTNVKRRATYSRAPVTRIRFCLHHVLNNYKILSTLHDLPLIIGTTKWPWSEILGRMCPIEAQSFLRFLVRLCTSKQLRVLTVSNSQSFRTSFTCCNLSKETNSSALCAKRSTTQQDAPSLLKQSSDPEDSAKQKQINERKIYEKSIRDQEKKLFLRIQEQKHLWLQPVIDQQEKRSAETKEESEEYKIIKIERRIRQLQEELHNNEPQQWHSFGPLLESIFNHEHCLKKLLCFVEECISSLKFKVGVLRQSDLKRKLLKFKTFQYYLEHQITYGEQLITKPYLLYLLENKINTIPSDMQLRYLFHLADVQTMALEIYKVNMED